MKRFLILLSVIFVASAPLVSCTLPPEDEAGDLGGPIDDEALNGEETAAAPSEDDGLESLEGDSKAQNDSAGEDDLEKEFSNSEEPPATAQEKTQEQATPDEISELDAELDEPVAQAPPPEAAPAPESTPVPVEPPPPLPQPVAEARTKVRDIRYVDNSQGGTVVIETEKPVAYQTRMNLATNQFVIEMADVDLPASLQRPYTTGGRVGSINAYQSPDSTTARVVVQLSGGTRAEPVVQQEGSSLVVIPPSPPVIAKSEGESPAAGADTSNNSQQGPLAARTLDEFLTGNQRFFGRQISLQVRDADVRDFINFLAEESGANIVMSDDVRGKISLKLRRVPWDQALVTVMRTKELGYVRQANVLRISTLRALQSETESANKILEAQKAITPSTVQVIPISYASLEDLRTNLKPFLSSTGQLVTDNRTQTLVVTDKVDVVDRISRLVKTLDIPPGQVSIESKIVEAGEEFERLVGVNWSMSGSETTLSNSGGANGAPITLLPRMSSNSLTSNFIGSTNYNAGITLGTLDIFGDLAASLSMAEKDNIAKVISAPRISAMNREKSTIQQKGENVAIITTRAELTGIITKQIARTPFALELNVTPQITSDGSVIMDLDVKREFLGPVVDSELQARAINSRFAKTKILVRNGQTAVIGGIYTSDELEATSGVPLLKDIPVLGWLFKTKQTNRAKNELLIFLTPRILADEVKATSI